MDKFILADTTAIDLLAGAGLSNMTTVCNDWAEAAALMPKLTPENLSNVQVQTGEGLTIGNYTDLVLQPGNWEAKDDGIHITISLREKTDIEKRLENVEAGQQTQDGAITDLGETVGKLAEGGTV